MFSLLLTSALVSSLHCNRLPGASEFARKTKARWVLLGESHHGTIEQPGVAADFLCAIIKTGRPVTVALEYSSADQVLLDAYLSSDGGTAARSALFKAWNWQSDNADGKSSEAMLRLLDWLGLQRRLGRIQSVVAFDAAAHGNDDRNRKMAAILQSIDPGKNGIIVALTGSYHAQRRTVLDRGAVISPPGALLPRGGTVDFVIHGKGGTAWMCQDGGCHVYSVPPSGTGKRGVRLAPTPDGEFDGVIELGTTESASPPADKG
jgi:hypothetical protein